MDFIFKNRQIMTGYIEENDYNIHVHTCVCGCMSFARGTGSFLCSVSAVPESHAGHDRQLRQGKQK